MSRISSPSVQLSADLRKLCALTSPLPSVPAADADHEPVEPLHLLAERHGLRPLLMRGLRHRKISLPQRSQDESFAIAASNLRASHALLEVAHAFTAKGIRLLGYKGPALAALLHGDVGLREFVDLDVMVAADDITAAKSALQELGYRPDLQLTSKQESDFRRDSSTFTFTRGDGVAFELQWQIAHRSSGVRFDFEQLWRRRVDVSLGSGSISTFSVNDQLLVLSLHGARHFWESLCWVADIAYLLQRPELDLPWVWREARERGVSNFVAWALRLAHDCFQAGTLDFPPEVSTVAVARAADLSYRRINALTIDPEWTNSEHAAFAAMLRSNWAKSSYFFSLVFTSGPDEWRATRLPQSLHFAYPLVRLSRLFRRSVLRFAK